MRILYINQDGSSYGNYEQVRDRTTVAQFVSEKTGGKSSDNYVIRVNSQIVAAEQVLCEGDRLSLTPKKVPGAMSLKCG